MPMTRLIAFCLTVLAVLGLSPQKFTTAQQTNPPFTIEQIQSAPFASDLIAAPTGERIAWVFNQEGKRNIWVADGPEFKARQLTQYNEDDGQELTKLSFTHDGRWIVYVRGGDENSQGEIPNPASDPAGALQAIFAVHVERGTVVPVALGSEPVVSTVDDRVVFTRNGKLWLNTLGNDPKKAAPLFDVRGGLDAPYWSPDGKQLAFTSYRGDHSFVCLYEFATEKLRYVAPSLDRDNYTRWSPDGKKLAFIRQPTRGTAKRSAAEDYPDPWAIWVADVATLQAKEIWRSGTTLNDSLPRWTGTSDTIQWVANERLVFRSESDGWMHLYSIAASGGEAKLLTPGKCEVETVTLTPDRAHLVFSSNCQEINTHLLSRLNLTSATLQPLQSGPANSWNPVVTASGKNLAFISSSAATAGEIVVLSPPNGLAQLSPQQTVSETRLKLPASPSARNAFPADRLGTPQSVTFKAADGLDIHGQLFLPKDAKPGEKLPAVIFSHGGPARQMWLGWHSMFYYHNTYAFNQFLASRGYAVLSVNYRGGTGYGRAFREAPKRGGRGASEYQDIVAGAQYLRARADIDAKRIGLWGGSYGGFLTAMGLAMNSDLFAAGVDIHGVHDWTPRMSGEEREVLKVARESSPLYNVDKWRAPVLLIHGDDDRNVAFNQTSELARRLREKNVEFEQMVIPDEVHDFLLHRTWVEVFKASFDFLERKLKNAKPRQTSWHQAAPKNQIGELQNNAHLQSAELNLTALSLPSPTPPAGLLLADLRAWKQPLALPVLRANAGFQASPQPLRVELLIRNGRLLDGSGANETRADIGITGDRISFIGNATKTTVLATRIIDASGLIVAPGFIDPHTHADEDLSHAQRKANINYLLQGVTTVVIGNDGRSPLPLSKKIDQLNAQGIGTNAIQLVGHGSVRGAVLGAADVAPNAEQLERMKSFVRQAMEDGAFGMSTGLYYAPGSFAKTEEVIELAKIVAAHGGIYDSHIRDESSYTIGLLGSIEEVIRIGREAKLPVHVSHIKALGVDVWGKSKDVIAVIEKARAAGINITANQYPYTASGTSITAALVPRWAEAGGNAELLKRLDDPAIRPRLIKEMEENMRRRGGANSLLITSGRNRAWAGKRLDEIAKAAGKSPIEAAIDIIKAGGAAVASFNMNEQDIEAFMKQPWVMTGSDGSGGHPRKYGTYPRKLSDYVMKRHVISLPRFIQASSAQVAETFGVKERGALRTGYFADLVVFDEKAVAELATYEQPEKLAVGMKYVLVNGKLAVEDGKYTGALAGRALRKKE